MLILRRDRDGDNVVIETPAGPVEIRVLDKGRIGITAPKSYVIRRGEVPHVEVSDEVRFPGLLRDWHLAVAAGDVKTAAILAEQLRDLQTHKRVS